MLLAVAAKGPRRNLPAAEALDSGESRNDWGVMFEIPYATIRQIAR